VEIFLPIIDSSRLVSHKSVTERPDAVDPLSCHEEAERQVVRAREPPFARRARADGERLACSVIVRQAVSKQRLTR
jgi:hypothetical protein